jgi:hypothetical protein
MGVVLGMNCKLYYGVAGSTADTLVDNVRDAVLGLETGETDVTTRGNGGWTATMPTLKAGNIDCSLVWDTDDDFFQAVQSAYFSSGLIALLSLDAESGTGTGLDADFSVLNFTRNESLTEAVTVDITFKPGYSTRAPQWVYQGS